LSCSAGDHPLNIKLLRSSASGDTWKDVAYFIVKVGWDGPMHVDGDSLVGSGSFDPRPDGSFEDLTQIKTHCLPSGMYAVTMVKINPNQFIAADADVGAEVCESFLGASENER
jgi:hypothetical protein